MLIWQGLGFLGALIPITSYLLTIFIVSSFAGTAYVNAHSWPGALGIFIGAACVWLLSSRLNTPERTLLDPQTGRTVMLKKSHTLFFIPMQYVAAILAVLAVVMLSIKHDRPL